MSKNKHLTKSLLVAAAALLASAPVAEAYNTSGWSTTSAESGRTYRYGPYYTPGGSEWYGSTSSSIDSLFGGIANLNLVYSGLYNVSGRVDWDHNCYSINNTPDRAEVTFQINGAVQDSYVSSASYSMWWRSNSYFLPINNATVSGTWALWGDNGTYVDAGWYQLSERNVQVARTGEGLNGQSATSAFATDNQAYGSNYATYSSRNILRTASFNSTAAVVGSVVRNGDIQLGNLGAYDALYAKDAGWLDVRGSLTISSAYGHVYLRDAEITSTVFTDSNAYNSAQARTQGSFFFESGILSVRNRFAQDMYVSGQQTIAFRDGAVNSTNLYIDGYGYYTGTSTYGSLRSISGSNVQNGNVGIGWNGSGEAYVAVDIGSTLTINGTVNGVNGGGSSGGIDLYFNVDGSLVQNGTIAAGVRHLSQWGSGDVRLNVANSFSGDLAIFAGSVTLGHDAALNLATSSWTNVYGGTLAFDTGDLNLSKRIYLNNGSALHVRSGDVTLSDVRQGSGSMNTTLATDSGTSLTLSTPYSWDLDGGTLTVNTALNSHVNLPSHSFAYLTLEKDGQGTLNLSGNSNSTYGNTYATINVNQGTVTASDGRMNGVFAVASGASVVLSDASLDRSWGLQVSGNGDSGNGYLGSLQTVSGTSNHVHDVIMLGDARFFVAKDSVLDLSYVYDRASLTPSTLTIATGSDAHGANYGRVTLDQVLDSIILNKTGGGVLEITGPGSQATTNVQGGILAAEHNDALGATTNVSSDASLVIASSNVHGSINLIGGNGYGVHTWNTDVPWRALTFWNNSGQDGLITLHEDTAISKLGTFFNTGTIRGDITSAVLTHPALDFYVLDGTLAISGDIDASVGAITKHGVGTTLAVSGNINTTAALNVNEGTVALSGTAANLAVNIASGATLEVNASNVFFNSASSGLTVVDVASGGNLVLGANGNAVTDTILELTGSGNISLLNNSTLNVLSGNYSGVVNSTGDLVKSGAASSTLLLTGASTYLGGTTVNGGTLNLTNVGSLTSDVVVNNGGVFVANGHVLADTPNDVAGNVAVSTGGLLKGSGIIDGHVYNTGTVAPGNSPGILTVNGGYTESGLLQIEIGGNDGAGVNPTGHDQLRVNGGNYAITAGATLQLSKYNSFEPARRDNYLAIDVAPTYGITGTFAALDRSTFSTQLFFDHSNGKVYGSGLTEAQTFAEYGLGNANRRAVGYALYQDGLISADTIKNGDSTASTAKAFVNGSTDLGAAVETLLLSLDPATVLDALSPEAYAGLGDSAARISRAHFSTLGSALNGATADWDFSVGYTDQRFRTGTSMTSLDQQSTNSSTHLSVNKAFNDQVSLAVLLSDERGHVNASNFAGSMTGWSAGIAGLYRGDSVNVQLGYVHTNGSADAVRNGAAANDIGVRADSIELKVTPVQKVDPKATYVLTPYASLVYTRSKSDAVVETSPGANLAVDAVSANSAYVELGADLMGKFAPDLQWTISAALATSLNSSATNVTARFVDAGVNATDFTVRSGGIHGLEAKLGAGLVKDFGSNTRGEIGVQAELGSNFSKALRFDAKVSKRF